MSNSNDFVITNGGKLKKYKGNEETVVVPEGVVEIGPVAFSSISGGPKSISLPDGLKKISYNAFIYCQNLINVNIPDGVTHIGASAFQGCTSLENITIPKSIQKMEAAFSSCTSLCDIIVPDDLAIREICWQAFSSESKIKYCFTNVKQGIALTPIESDFLKRNFTTAVEIAIARNDIGALEATFATRKKIAVDIIDSLLEKCANVKEMYSFVLEYKAQHYSNKDAIRSQEEKETNPAGRSVTEWRKIFKIPASPKDEKVTIDGYKSDDKEVLIPGKIGKYDVTAISKNAFKRMAEIVKVTFEDGVTTIGVDSFLKCLRLKKVVLPQTLTSIEWGAFAGCVSLLDIEIPSNVKEFSEGVFAGCSSLKNVTIADGVTIIGNGAFDSCLALEKISIPSSVKTIGFGAFFGCPNVSIYAPKGSYAIEYAKENNIQFVEE